MLNLFHLKIFDHRFAAAATLLGIILLTAGCQRLTGDSVIQIIGEVRLDRRPIADAKVAFVPVKFRNRSGAINPIGFGTTNTTGRFELRTQDTKGIVPGEYRVLFFQTPADRSAAARVSQNELRRPPQNDPLQFWESCLDIVFPFQEDDVTPRSPLFQITLANIQSQSIPMQYNLESELRFDVKSGSGIVYPKFELHSHPDY